MPRSALEFPSSDPTPIFEQFRGSYGTELLTAAVAHFRLFDRLGDRQVSLAEFADQLQLSRRPAVVLICALRAMGLLTRGNAETVAATPLAAAHLRGDAAFDVSGYIGLAADSPGVRDMVERLRTNRPLGAVDQEQGTAFVYQEGTESAMEHEASARHLTMALAGRARNVAPHLARNVPLGSARHLLDVGGGTGIYSIALLQRHPHLQATVWDRPEVLKVASEMAREYGVADRLHLAPGDMFADPVPTGCDLVLLSNVLHDWDEADCARLVDRCARALPRGGQLWIHDVLLDDDLGGPLPIALYSAALFQLTWGRAYSRAEYAAWLTAAGLQVQPPIPTLIHCHLLPASRAN